MTLITVNNYTVEKSVVFLTLFCLKDHPPVCGWSTICVTLSYFHLFNTKKAHLKLEILHLSHFFALQNEQLLLMLKQC